MPPVLVQNYKYSIYKIMLVINNLIVLQFTASPLTCRKEGTGKLRYGMVPVLLIF